MGSPSSASSLAAVPLFPLPNVVLFPRAVLPLHIFEHRYRQMTADALAGQKQIAMAILKPGWEKSYFEAPELEPVVCVGTILSHEKFRDGKYNFLLQGHSRARIVQEIRTDKPYRLARLEPLLETAPPDDQMTVYRRKFEELLGGKPVPAEPCASQLHRLIDSPLPTAEIADLIAFSCFDDVSLKQSLLAESDVRKRVERVLDQLRIVLDHALLMQAAAQQPNLN